MRIAYVVHYQGPGFVRERPSLHNFSLGNRVKIELIAKALKANGHEVEILSQGEVDRNEFKFYPFYRETEPFDPEIPVLYASALPVKYVNGFWSSKSTCALLKARNRVAPFDLLIIHTLKTAQMACARLAQRSLKIPVVLEYEDDAFSDALGRSYRGPKARYHASRYRQVLTELSGCIGVSPYLLSQAPVGMPRMLLRGIVNRHIAHPETSNSQGGKNRVVFSGTHEGAQGLDQMIEAWKRLNLRDWELHIAGQGPITPRLKAAAQGTESIVFHGLLDQKSNAGLICSAKIGMNPQDPTRVPGTSFAFKIIEYLAAGLHVVTTPRGELEPELEQGVTYIQENSPETIAAALGEIISHRRYEKTAREATLNLYAFDAISHQLNRLFSEIGQTRRRNKLSGRSPEAAIPASAQ